VPNPVAVIGLSEINPHTGVDLGVLAVAQQLAAVGHQVVVLDADPFSGMLTPWAVEQGVSGPPMDVLLTQWLRGLVPTLISEPLAELLGEDVGLGAVGVVHATNAEDPTRRAAPPTTRALRLMRESLNSLTLAGAAVDVVLVRLPPLSTASGVALGANLVDVLVPLLVPTASAIRQAAKALHQLTTLRGQRPVLLPVEIVEEGDTTLAASEPLWLAGLGVVPMCQVRLAPEFVITDDPSGSTEGPDFRDVADALRLQLALPHPFGQERLWEADALNDAPGAYAAFLSLIEEDAVEALQFFGESLSGRGATRATAVEALRAMVESGRYDDDDLAWVFKYVVQRFRTEERDPRAEFMLSLGTRLLRSADAGLIPERLPRVTIDAAEAMVYAAQYRDGRGERGFELLPEAERLLMKAGLEVSEAPDIMRLVEALGVHARVSGKDDHCGVALALLNLAMKTIRKPAQARQKALDVLSDFYVACKDEELRKKHMTLALSIVDESPAHAHYNLILAFSRAGDKFTASEHLIALGKVDPERFRAVFEDPDMDAFLNGHGKDDFYSPGPKRGGF
jgi:hypothetical protein